VNDKSLAVDSLFLQREAPAALAEKESDSNPEEAAHENPAGGMLGGAATQVNAKKQNDWLEGRTTMGQSRARFEARKVNSKQKK
jgi:hypothetical protein